MNTLIRDSDHVPSAAYDDHDFVVESAVETNCIKWVC